MQKFQQLDCLLGLPLRVPLYGACRQVVKTSDCDSDIRGFESHHAPQTWMYSIMVVRLLHTESSGSSTLLTSTKHIPSSPSWLRHRILIPTFRGSNP